MLTVLPRSFVPATGFTQALTSRALPLALPGIHAAMTWRVRHDADPAQRWLRERIGETVPTLPAQSSEPGQTRHALEALPDRGGPYSPESELRARLRVNH